MVELVFSINKLCSISKIAVCGVADKYQLWEASKLRVDVDEGKENASKNALTNPSLRDLPIVLISAWRDNPIYSPQTVTFDSFLANFNNAARPGDGF